MLPLLYIQGGPGPLKRSVDAASPAKNVRKKPTPPIEGVGE